MLEAEYDDADDDDDVDKGGCCVAATAANRLPIRSITTMYSSKSYSHSSGNDGAFIAIP